MDIADRQGPIELEKGTEDRQILVDPQQKCEQSRVRK